MLAWQAQSFGLKIFSQITKKKKTGLKIPCGLDFRCSEPPTEKYQRVVFGLWSATSIVAVLWF